MIIPFGRPPRPPEDDETDAWGADSEEGEDFDNEDFFEAPDSGIHRNVGFTPPRRHPGFWHGPSFRYEAAYGALDETKVKAAAAKIPQLQSAWDLVTAQNKKVVNIKLKLTLYEYINGCEKIIRYNHHQLCRSCYASEYQRVRACHDCQGEGKFLYRLTGNKSYEKVCERCHGKGKIPTKRCLECKGKYFTNKKQSLRVPVAPGTANTVLNKDEHPRKIKIHITLAETAGFTVINKDIGCTIEISPAQATTGDTVKIDDPGGLMLYALTIPPGVVSGQMLRVKGHGVQNADKSLAGDLLCTIKIISAPENNERPIN